MRKKVGLNMRIFMTCILVFILNIVARAQNNPYKIDDRLYPSMAKIAKMIRQPSTLNEINKFIVEARKIGDVKAQCLGYTYIVQYYYAQNDINSMIKSIDVVRDFSIKTPYKQYVFSGWNNLVNYYIRKDDYKNALDEATKYYNMALKIENVYGISMGYRLLARIYYSINQTDKGNEMLEIGAKFLLEKGETKELDQFYVPLGVYYLQKNDTKKAAYYFELAQKYNVDPTRMLSTHLSMLELKSLSDEYAEAEYYYKKVQEDQRKYGRPFNINDSYYKAIMSYYLMKGDNKKAMAYSDSINALSVKLLSKGVIYRSEGNYKEAFNFRKRLIELNDSIDKGQNAKIIAQISSEYNNQKLEMEKHALALENKEILLKQSEEQRHYLELDNEHRILHQNNAELKLKNNDLQLKQQQEYLKQQQQRADTLELKEKNRAMMLYMTLVLLSMIFIAFIAFYINRKEYIKKIIEEKSIADEARRHAEKADSLKSLFLQNVSHELRTPLNAIVGFSEMLDSEIADDMTQEEKHEATNIIKMNSNILTTLINDILDLSKMESGTYKVELHDASVNDICSNALSSVKGMEKSGVVLMRGDNWNAHQEEKFIICTDISRIHQVLTNFLSNACKNTDSGSIVLDFSQVVIAGKPYVRFSVTDTGCGIPIEKAESIFSRFEKLDAFKQGTGLGLNICKVISNMLHGNIYLDTSYQDGARFVFEHPIEPIWPKESNAYNPHP